MSHHDDQFGTDALTPFEFALAGVTPPGTPAISSLRVIEDMRSLVDGLDEIPIVRPELQDFLDSSGWLSLGADRRRQRAKHAGAGNGRGKERAARGNGAFVDITPPDMVGTGAVPEVEGPPEPRQDATLPAASTDAAEPMVESVADDPDGQRSIDAVQAELQSVLARSETAETEAEISSTLADQLATGPVAADAIEADDADGDGEDAPDPAATTASAKASITDRLRDGDGRFGPTLGPHVEDLGQVVGLGAGATAAKSPAEPDLDTHEIVEEGGEPATIAALLSGVDRPGPTGLDGEDQLGTTEDEPAAVVASGAGFGLLGGSGPDGPPMASVATVRPAAAPAGRPGGTLLALVGAGAAAAVLVAGSLWWATSSSTTSTEADQPEPEVAAPAATEAAETPAGSLDGSAERSTGDDRQSAEFQPNDDSATPVPASSTVLRPSIPSSDGGRTSTTVGTRPSTTTTTAGTTGVSTAPPSTAAVEVSTTRAADTTTSRPTTTAQLTTATRPTTTRSPATTLPPARPVFIGDRVTIGSYDGDGLGGVQVSLHVDADRDGRTERLLATTSTGSDGRYSFDQPPGCYEVRFSAPNGYRIRADLARQYLCLDSGGVAARVDAIAEPTAAPPTGCLVERAGSAAGLGVEVYESGGNWASSYTFYSSSGAVVARTRDLGPYDTDPGEPNDREWFGAENGFDHRAVRSVAAERNGVESSRLTCARQN